ncbi:zinc finger E-box-binding homeobox 2-like isoform X3 [Tachypleus tridentatus]|uniref:zinc finger E-box-binding homeobox 2-like isoform X3 n=1 Tax=Tachypleus tridentatus TaxID=6853 RepID=UPI003FD6BB8C
MLSVSCIGARHICPLCKKSYSLSTNLKRHLRLHHDRQSKSVKVTATCPVCGQKLATSSSLNRHLATHYPSTSKYECNLCGKHVKRKDHYNLHMRQAHGSREQLYVCPKCDKVFTTGHYLNRHLFWAHSEDDSTKSNE